MNRRNFLKTGALSATAIASLSATAAAGSTTRGRAGVVGKNDAVLFQGDSITDAGRSRNPESTGRPNNQPGLGNGYAWLAAMELLVDRPADGLKMFNRGNSGNQVYQLAERWQADCLDLRPDVLSILIGVNDIWHTIEGGYQGTVEIYERDYCALIERTKKALPKVRLVICEPFVLRCGAVTDKWFPEFDKYRASARRVAEKNHAAFVPFQAMFDEAGNYAPAQHWAGDGVHPSPEGAALMANFWLETVTEKRLPP